MLIQCGACDIITLMPNTTTELSKSCEYCGKVFFSTRGDAEHSEIWRKRRFCSRSCGGQANRRGSLMSCEECCAEYWMPPHVIAKHLGRFCSVECKAKWMSRTYTGEGSPMWKGDRVSYSVLHHWVVRHRGKADHCAFDPSHKPKYYDWANKSGQYLRDLDDWIPLCRPCHRKFDRQRPKQMAYPDLCHRAV